MTTTTLECGNDEPRAREDGGHWTLHCCGCPDRSPDATGDHCASCVHADEYDTHYTCCRCCPHRPRVPTAPPEVIEQIAGIPIDARWAYEWAYRELQEWPEWDDDELTFQVALSLLSQRWQGHMWDLIEADPHLGVTMINLMSEIHAPVPLLHSEEEHEPAHYQDHDWSLGWMVWATEHFMAPLRREEKERAKLAREEQRRKKREHAEKRKPEPAQQMGMFAGVE